MANKTLGEQYRERMKAVGAVLANEPECREAMEHAAKALRNISKALAETDYEYYLPCDECHRQGLSPDKLAKAGADVGRMIDQVTRLLEYAQGNADSRSEIKGLDDLLKFLTTDQFAKVCAWIEAGSKKEKPAITIN